MLFSVDAVLLMSVFRRGQHVGAVEDRVEGTCLPWEFVTSVSFGAVTFRFVAVIDVFAVALVDGVCVRAVHILLVDVLDVAVVHVQEPAYRLVHVAGARVAVFAGAIVVDVVVVGVGVYLPIVW